jgi:hypothetical protein
MMATDMLHGISKGATHEETPQALMDHFGEEHVATAYGCQLKLRTQGIKECLLDFATMIEHPAPPHLSNSAQRPHKEGSGKKHLLTG